MADLTAVRAYRSDRAPACVGDFDGDSDTDSDDVLGFFTAFDAGDNAADSDGDGDTDSDDIILFFAAWDSGC